VSSTYPPHPGILELSKSFLDPFGAEGTAVDINTGVLLAEVNAGCSRWKRAGEVWPDALG